jgi:hypothetical protein
LLNDDIATYLEEIRKRGSRLEAINKTLKPLPVGNERSALVQQEEELFSWMMEQLPVGLVEKFKPCLSV